MKIIFITFLLLSNIILLLCANLPDKQTEKEISFTIETKLLCLGKNYSEALCEIWDFKSPNYWKYLKGQNSSEYGDININVKYNTSSDHEPLAVFYHKCNVTTGEEKRQFTLRIPKADGFNIFESSSRVTIEELELNNITDGFYDLKDLPKNKKSSGIISSIVCLISGYFCD